MLPEKIDDFGMLQLARDVAIKIESELKYPGEIKVNVIRKQELWNMQGKTLVLIRFYPYNLNYKIKGREK